MKYAAVLSACLAVVCVNGQDGPLDPSFGGDGIVTLPGFAARAMAIDSEGRIVLASQTVVTNSDPLSVVRYTPDGSLDLGFGNGGVVTTVIPATLSWWWDLLTYPDGRILVLGGVDDDVVLIRYTSDGALDPLFGVDGILTTQVFTGARGVELTANGRILVAGTYCGPEAVWCDAAVAAFLEDGSVDTGFGLNGIAFMDADLTDGGPGNEETDEAYDLAIQPDGKIIVVGRGGPWWGADIFLARYHADGTVDLDFGDDGRVLTNVGGIDYSNAVAVAPDGRIHVTGYYTGGTSPQDAYIAGYMPNGDLDPSFGDAGLLLLGSGLGNAVAVQSDGKPVLALYASDYWLVRYNVNGTPDATLNSGGVIPAPSQAGNSDVALQDDGRILVSGLRGDSLVVVRYLSDWSVGVLALTNARELMVYPNPIAEQAVFEYALTTTGKVSCELVDIQGRSVRTLFNAQRPAGQHRETLDLSGITAGQYMLVLRAEEGRTNVRVVKQ